MLMTAYDEMMLMCLLSAERAESHLLTKPR